MGFLDSERWKIHISRFSSDFGGEFFPRATGDREFSGGGDSCIRMHCIKIDIGKISKVRCLGLFDELYIRVAGSVSTFYSRKPRKSIFFG